MKAKLIIRECEPMSIYRWNVVVKSFDDEHLYYYDTARFKVTAWLKYFVWRYIKRKYIDRDRTVIKEIELKE